MSVFTSSVVPDLFSALQRVKSAVQRICFRMVPPRFTDWYVNAAGNFAIRAHVICSDEGSVTLDSDNAVTRKRTPLSTSAVD
ncbi:MULTISPECIES: hypothetical protein [Serratia]|uniref:hypothetical protein n=1 Tax=Serratia TaxID=613 RepID=UPI001F1562E7|nr:MULTISPECIES: hypothetical protein [Serratia]MDI9110338.1 hypothetical protein [Serratia marcescens]MDR8536423.1 hypothetical protein [Serratia nevei]